MPSPARGTGGLPAPHGPNGHIPILRCPSGHIPAPGSPTAGTEAVPDPSGCCAGPWCTKPRVPRVTGATLLPQQPRTTSSRDQPHCSSPAHRSLHILPSRRVPRAPALCSPSLTGAVPVLPPQRRAGCSQRAFSPPPPSLWLCFTTHFISCQEPNVFFKEWVIATNVLNAIALAAVSVPRLNYYN